MRRPVAPLGVVGAVESAFPPAVDQASLLEGYFLPRAAERPGGSRLARAAFAASGVRRRHAALDPRQEDSAAWSTGRRMARFVDLAVPLATAAVDKALRRAGLVPADVGLLAVATCTGYATPGVDVLVARALGCAPDTRRLLIGHAGCHAGLVGLGALADAVAARGSPAVLCCVELPSLHLQPDACEPEQLVVHALFGDAVGALVLLPASTGPPDGLELLATASTSRLDEAELLTWTVTDQGFRMGLSRRVPEAVGKAVGPLVDGLLSPFGLASDTVAHWAVHPGGPRVLDAVESALGLDPRALGHSREVLAQRGNCSSATVLLVLEALLAGAPPAPGDHVVLLAFGPGLTLEAALFQAR